MNKQTWTCSVERALGARFARLVAKRTTARLSTCVHRFRVCTGDRRPIFLALTRRFLAKGPTAEPTRSADIKGGRLSAKPMTSRSAFERSGERLRGFRVGREK